MSDSNKSITIPTFSGKNEDFQVWWTKFRAFGTAKEFVNALLAQEADLSATEATVLNETVDTDKPKIKAKERNSLAMAYLLNTFKAEADISLAYETMTTKWPGGLAHKVVKKLFKIYKPDDDITEVEVYERLLEVKIKRKDDPRTLFEQVASIKNWYKTGTKSYPKDR